jgi:hypothetical protein
MNDDITTRIRATVWTLAKQEVDEATSWMIQRPGMEPTLGNVVMMERQLLDVLFERLRRMEHDPLARLPVLSELLDKRETET